MIAAASDLIRSGYRCNCGASCGENRYHDVGDPECRYVIKEKSKLLNQLETSAQIEEKKCIDIENEFLGRALLRRYRDGMPIQTGDDYKPEILLEALRDAVTEIYSHRYKKGY